MLRGGESGQPENTLAKKSRVYTRLHLLCFLEQAPGSLFLHFTFSNSTKKINLDNLWYFAANLKIIPLSYFNVSLKTSILFIPVEQVP